MADSPDFIADAQFVPDQGTSEPSQQEATHAVGAPEFIPDHQFISDEDKYGSIPQQAIAGLEGAARGATLGGSDIALIKLGVTTPEAIKGRMEENPWTSIAGNVIGAGGLIAATGGLAAPVESAVLGSEALEAGMAAAKAAQAAGVAAPEVIAAGKLAAQATAGSMRSLAGRVIGTAAEGSVFGAGNAVSDYALGDPNLNAQKIISEIGLGTVLGGAAGALSKGIETAYSQPTIIKDSISSIFGKRADVQNAASETANVLKEAERENISKEVSEAAKRLDIPLAPGMGTTNPWVEKATDALINGAPTYSGIKVNNQYAEAYNKVVDTLDNILPEQRLSKAEIGNAFKGSITNKIAEENAPISKMYENIKQYTQDIPLSEKSAPSIARNILDLQEVKVTPNSPAAKLANQIAEELSSLKTVDDVKFLKSSLRDRVSPTASSGEKRMVGILSDKLTDLEENSIERFASNNAVDDESKKLVTSLIDERKAANAQYKPFIEKIKTLSEQLGKGKVYGPQDAINFINDLTPEELTQKLFAKNNSEFLGFFEKHFPEQAALMREYQKGVMREAASKTGTFSPKVFFNQVNKLEPEVQKSVFFPDELSKIKDSETFIRHGMPKNFNPSGTSGMSAFRAFFEHPTGALVSNLRDFGIEAYIKTAGQLPENLRPNAAALGSKLAQQFNKLNAARELADEFTARMNDNISTIFTQSSARSGAISGAISGTSDYDDKVKKVEMLSQNPNILIQHLSNHTEGIHQDLPNITQGINNSVINGLQYLNKHIPKPTNTMPIKGRFEPSRSQKSLFNKRFQAVNDPISVLKSVKEGTLSNEQMEALQEVHPQLLNEMKQKAMMAMDPKKTEHMPYSTKISLAKFLGAPLDQNMLPQSIAVNQHILAGPNQSNQQSAGPIAPSRRGTGVTLGGLKELNIAQRESTISQSLEDEKI